MLGFSSAAGCCSMGLLARVFCSMSSGFTAGWGLGLVACFLPAKRCFQPSRATPWPLSGPVVSHCNF